MNAIRVFRNHLAGWRPHNYETSSDFCCAANLLRGLKCVFCGSLTLNRTHCGSVRCRTYRRQKSLAKIRLEIAILQRGGLSRCWPISWRMATSNLLIGNTNTGLLNTHPAFHVPEIVVCMSELRDNDEASSTATGSLAKIGLVC